MAPTTFLKASLSSRTVRSLLTKGSGVREMNLNPFVDEKKPNPFIQIFQAAGGIVVKVFNFLNGALQWLGVAKKTVGDWLKFFFVDGVKAITTYNWNESDSEIKESIKEDLWSLTEQGGELFGYAVSSTVVLGVTYLIPVVGPILAVMSLPEVTAELSQQLLIFFKEALTTALKVFVKGTYLAVRSILRSLARKNGEALKKLPGGEQLYNALSNWGVEGGKPWTIAGAIQEKIEGLPGGGFLSEAFKRFVEGAAEGIVEGYQETVAVVAVKLDDYLQTQVALNKATLGGDKKLKIEVVEDTANPMPPITVSGPRRILEATASSTIATIQTLATRDIGTVYSQPSDAHQQKVTFLPHVKLIFWENLEDVEKGYSALEAELSFRLHDETYQSWTPQKSERLAEKIKNIFAKPRYRFQKGQTKCVYRDRAKGYQLMALVSNEAGARDLFEKTLEIQGDTFDSAKFGVNKLGKTLPTVPDKQIIYGQTRRLPRQRPTGWVVFNNAQLHLWGIPHSIVLVDCSRRKRNAIIRV